MKRRKTRAKKAGSRKPIRASKWDRKRKAILYTCGVHFQHEMTEAMGPQVFYNSLEDLKEVESCWTSCGIVEVDVMFSRWIRPQTLEKEFDRSKMTTPAQLARLEKNLKVRANLWLKYLSDLIKIHVRKKKSCYAE